MRNGADGASAERTRLAWRRTALTTTAVALLTVRVAVRDGYSRSPSRASPPPSSVGWPNSWSRSAGSRRWTRRRPGNIGRTLPAFALVIIGFVVLGIVLTVA